MSPDFTANQSANDENTADASMCVEADDKNTADASMCVEFDDENTADASMGLEAGAEAMPHKDIMCPEMNALNVYHIFKRGGSVITTFEYLCSKNPMIRQCKQEVELSDKRKQCYHDIFTLVLENTPYCYTERVAKMIADDCVDLNAEITDIPFHTDGEGSGPSELLQERQNMEIMLQEDWLILHRNFLDTRKEEEFHSKYKS